MPIYLIHRVVILNVPPPHSDNVRVQKRIAVERAKVEQKRHRKRKRLFAPEPAVKPVRRRPPIIAPGVKKKPRDTKDPDIVPPEQRPAIAQALLTDALADRLLDRLKIATVPDAEVKAALSALHLSPQAAASREGALALCGRLDAQAVLTPKITGVTLHDGITRDCVLHATIRIPGVQLDEASHAESTASPAPTDALLPNELVIAGFAHVDRVLFGSQYTQFQAATIRLAAQQAAALAVHTLLTGQVAPFMRPGARLAITPVSSPTRADRMLFTAQGRRIMRNAVYPLPANVSNRFKPQLLPLLPEQILTPSELRAKLASVFIRTTPGKQTARSGHLTRVSPAPTPATPLAEGATYWIDADTPNIKQAQALAKRLGVDYVLMAHVTDIELEEGPPPSEAPAISSATEMPDPKSKTRPSKSPDREREAKAEAVGALVRAADGALLWHAHASATMSALLSGRTAPSSWPTEQRIAGDAMRFALVDLERQLTHYRATFEK